MPQITEGERLRKSAQRRVLDLRAAARDHEREAATLRARAEIIERTWELERKEPQDA